MRFDLAWSWTRWQIGIEWLRYRREGYCTIYLLGWRATWFYL